MELESLNKLKFNLIYFYLFCLLFISGILLLMLINSLSVSYYEAFKIFNKSEEFFDLASFLANLSIKIFPKNDFSLRIPFLILHFFNVILMFYFSKGFLKKPSDAFFCAALFCLLPGVNASAILVLNSGVVIFFTLIFCLILQKTNKIFYPLLILLCFLDKSFALVFLALIFYGIANKNTILIFISLFLFGLNMYLFGLDISGKPKGHFLDNNGHLILIFSPLVFLYFLYTIYRYFNSKNKPLVWYIASVTLGFIWIISFRQRVRVEDFAPLLLVALPLMIKLYFSGLRVRLPRFRARYKIPFILAFLMLVLTSATLFLSKPLFLLTNEHFATQHFLAKELAQNLKSRGITHIRTLEKLQIRLKFYGIEKGDKNARILSEHRLLGNKFKPQKIPLFYYNKQVAEYYLY